MGRGCFTTRGLIVSQQDPWIAFAARGTKDNPQWTNKVGNVWKNQNLGSIHSTQAWVTDFTHFSLNFIKAI